MCATSLGSCGRPATLALTPSSCLCMASAAARAAILL
eukprot:CAMPEP_0205937316 /NCGR_PEP_ID=MMETSP1325-20131115/43867_1 /ASSEMBLY_ACC=CAM_ASM_000708 /TAXON_ID=236786 /ORGANISM="Florenciella sp., Strain RCC1007" /LENGTH=36 /DNA_ID= /DNA_START= /DNA_END= /DNA_ORIENTATION=